VTRWIEGLRQGDPQAFQAICDRYLPELQRAARQKLRGMASRVADEEDVALSAMNSFLMAAERGRFPDLADREGLWRLLLEITIRKAIDLRRHESRQKRGGGKVRIPLHQEGVLDESPMFPLDQQLAKVLAPDFAAMMVEQCERLLAKLTKDQYRSVAVAKMQGLTNKEIVDQHDCSVRTIERQLNIIRRSWEDEDSG